MASHQEYVAEAAAKAVMSHINDCFDRRCVAPQMSRRSH
jgi:hypothetical protein